MLLLLFYVYLLVLQLLNVDALPHVQLLNVDALPHAQLLNVDAQPHAQLQFSVFLPRHELPVSFSQLPLQPLYEYVQPQHEQPLLRV